jgi:hypothetical protein
VRDILPPSSRLQPGRCRACYCPFRGEGDVFTDCCEVSHEYEIQERFYGEGSCYAVNDKVACNKRNADVY